MGSDVAVDRYPLARSGRVEKTTAKGLHLLRRKNSPTGRSLLPPWAGHFHSPRVKTGLRRESARLPTAKDETTSPNLRAACP